MRLAYIAVLVTLTAALVMTTNAVVRLENYRYANFLGSCSQFDVTNPAERIKRESCLENSTTRINWYWHVLYGLKII